MKRFFFISALALSLFASTVHSDAQTVAFPGAEGFGMFTTGGRGGAVYHVNSLADDGSEGTLRWALAHSGAKTIVFDVSGTIFLNSELSVNANTTIAGQTAPGDGICVADYPFTIKGNNVIVRYMRFRLGNRQVANHEGDGLGGMDLKDIIVDHCSVSWSVDECLSVYGSHNLTVQWCLVSQSMNNAGHSKGAHGYGGNWGGSGASYHHNLMAHHNSRVPRLGPRASTQTDERMDLRNNVFYNWAGNGCYGGEGMNVNIVNNYYKIGPGTKTRSEAYQYRIAAPGIRTTEYCKRVVADDGSVTGNSWLPMWHVWGTFYLDGNVNPDYENVTNDNWTYGLWNQIDRSYSGNDGMLYVSSSNPQEKVDSIMNHMHLTEPIDFYPVTTHSASLAYDKVLAFAGASLHRDGYDALMISDAQNGTASYTGGNGTTTPGMIDNQSVMIGAYDGTEGDNGEAAWPLLSSLDAPADSDQDGMPDAWESANGLDPNDPDDRNSLTDEGFTMLEVYMNSLVADITAAQLTDGTVLGQVPVSESDTTDESNLSELSSGCIVYPLLSFGADTTVSLSGYAESDVAPYISVSDVAVGSSLFVKGFKLINDTPFAEIGTSVNNAALASESNAISFPLSVADGYSFKPTHVSFLMAKCGTNGSLFDLNWISSVSQSSIISADSPNRNNLDGGWFSTYDVDVSVPAFSGDASLSLNVYKLGDTKSVALYDVVVTGVVYEGEVAIVSDAVELVSSTESDLPVDVFNLSGRLVRSGIRLSDVNSLPRGIYVVAGRIVLVK